MKITHNVTFDPVIKDCTIEYQNIYKYVIFRYAKGFIYESTHFAGLCNE